MCHKAHFNKNTIAHLLANPDTVDTIMAVSFKGNLTFGGATYLAGTHNSGDGYEHLLVRVSRTGEVLSGRRLGHLHEDLSHKLGLRLIAF